MAARLKSKKVLPTGEVEIFCDCKVTRTTEYTKKGEPSTPKGWKRHQDRWWCADCWRDNWCIRAVTFPISGPAPDKDDEGERVDPNYHQKEAWNELGAAMRQAWVSSTQVANLTVDILRRMDITRTPDMEKLPKFNPPGKEIYGQVTKNVPECDASSANIILRRAQSSYMQSRFDVVWLRKGARDVFKYPVPYPFQGKDWHIEERVGGSLVFSCFLAGKRRLLRLRTGPGFRRQREAVLRLLKGELLAGEAALYEGHANEGDHRHGHSKARNGGRNARSGRIMLKLCMWFPKEKSKQTDKTVMVRTDQDSFLVYSVEGDEKVSRLNADHLKRWVASYLWRSARYSDDLKAENRSGKRRRDVIVDGRQNFLTKHKNRVDTFCHQVSAMLVNYAVRRKCKKVVYDDTYKGYLDQFTWFTFKEKIKAKLNFHGIQFEDVSSGSDEGSDKKEKLLEDASV